MLPAVVAVPPKPGAGVDGINIKQYQLPSLHRRPVHVPPRSTDEADVVASATALLGICAQTRE